MNVDPSRSRGSSPITNVIKQRLRFGTEEKQQQTQGREGAQTRSTGTAQGRYDNGDVFISEPLRNLSCMMSIGVVLPARGLMR
jgi:hypothetical protein